MPTGKVRTRPAERESRPLALLAERSKLLPSTDTAKRKRKRVLVDLGPIEEVKVRRTKQGR